MMMEKSMEACMFVSVQPTLGFLISTLHCAISTVPPFLRNLHAIMDEIHFTCAFFSSILPENYFALRYLSSGPI